VLTVHLVSWTSTDPHRIALPFPGIAWSTPNVLGHVAATPFTVVLDVALLPIWILGGVLYAAGIGHV
jgi:hypothetical protein